MQKFTPPSLFVAIDALKNVRQEVDDFVKQKLAEGWRELRVCVANETDDETYFSHSRFLFAPQAHLNKPLRRLVHEKSVDFSCYSWGGGCKYYNNQHGDNLRAFCRWLRAMDEQEWLEIIEPEAEDCNGIDVRPGILEE